MLALKAPADFAEVAPMAQARNALCALVTIVLVAVPLSGLIGGENGSVVSAQPGQGLVGGMVAQLKREDDQTELKEIAEHQPRTKEEREEAREQAESAQQAASQAQEQPRLGE
jgi:hypothetical protein